MYCRFDTTEHTCKPANTNGKRHKVIVCGFRFLKPQPPTAHLSNTCIGWVSLPSYREQSRETRSNAMSPGKQVWNNPEVE